MRALLAIVVVATVACGDDAPAPMDAPLPLCSELGCSNTLCTHCTTSCMGAPCEVP